jgi:hypothetical protein
MAQPAKYDIGLTAGDDFQVTVRLLDDGDPINTSGYTFTAQVRAGYFPDAPLLADFAVAPITGGAILSLTSGQTRQLGQSPRLVWDLQSASPEIRTWLSGRVLVAQEVTA